MTIKLLKLDKLYKAFEPAGRAGKHGLLLLPLLACMAAPAHELTERLSLDGVLSAALQCQDLSDNRIAQDTCKGAAPLQPAFTYRATSHDRLYLKLGFAAGDGLNTVSPFNIPSWGADLSSDVTDINSSGRDYLLELWYEHVFRIEQRNQLGVTLGIIDASSYLDQNRYANDEYTQFMNPALSNAPNSFLPAYDPGIAAEWLLNQWTLAGVIMHASQATTDERYTFYGLQAGYRLDTPLGTGNYRVLYNGDRNIVNQVGSSRSKNDLLIVSLDQQFGRTVGAFARLGWRLDDEPITYRAIYSGGLDVRGAAWGRQLDNIGLGLAYLEGGSGAISLTRIAESYYRLVFNPYLALTADLQYMEDRYAADTDVEGMIYSLRATLNF